MLVRVVQDRHIILATEEMRQLSMAETLESILRPLAERTGVCDSACHTPTTYADHKCTRCDGLRDDRRTIPDPRFDALRGIADRDDPALLDFTEDNWPAFKLDTSLGAEYRAIAACGFRVERIETFKNGETLVSLEEVVGPHRWHGSGGSPELAMARAFATAVGA